MAYVVMEACKFMGSAVSKVETKDDLWYKFYLESQQSLDTETAHVSFKVQRQEIN